MEQTIEVLVKSGANTSLGTLLGESPSQIGLRLGGRVQELLCGDPRHQDLNTAVSAANVARVRALEAVLDRLDADELAALQTRHDALALQALLHEAAFGWDGH